MAGEKVYWLCKAGLLLYQAGNPREAAACLAEALRLADTLDEYAAALERAAVEAARRAEQEEA